MNRLSEQSTNRELVAMLTGYIDENHSRQLKLGDLARIAHMNETYLSELFKQEKGLGYAEYLSGVRIRHAAQLLLSTNEKVAVIGRMVGYPRETSFRRAFRRETMMSPVEYRLSLGADSCAEQS